MPHPPRNVHMQRSTRASCMPGKSGKAAKGSVYATRKQEPSTRAPVTGGSSRMPPRSKKGAVCAAPPAPSTQTKVKCRGGPHAYRCNKQHAHLEVAGSTKNGWHFWTCMACRARRCKVKCNYDGSSRGAPSGMAAV